jgi:Protein of unknown function (DUF1236)
MRKTVIGAAAAATVALTGLAFADQQSGQEKQKPAASQMERGKVSATGKEGAATQAQGQTAEERQGQGEKMGATAQERANEGSAAGQRQGEAQHTETQTQKELTGQAGKQENGASQIQTERGANRREPGKAAEDQNRMEGAQNRQVQQRAGETNRTENDQPAQTERREMQGSAAERGKGGSQTARSPNREGMTHEGRNREGMTGEGQTSTAAGTNGGSAAVEAKGSAHLSNEQASRIADTLRTTSPAQTSGNVNVNVGEPLPGSVELLPLPPSIVDIVPEYRGYDYVVVRDEIVIVQPSTRKVVEVIHRGGETHAMGEAIGHGHRLTLSQSQQRLIRDTVTREHLPEAQVGEQFSYGVTVPPDVMLEPVPQPLIAQIPMIEQYRMFVVGGDRIVLVDPDTREVVDVIE